MINKGGKTLTIFTALIIILLISSTSIGFYLYHLEQRMRKKTEVELDTSRTDGVKLQTQLKDVQTQLALSQDKNKEADQKINGLLDERDLNEGLRNALKKENVDLKEQLATIDASKQRLKAALDDAETKLTQYQQLLKSSEDKSKELENHLNSLADANKGNETKIRELSAALSAAQKPVAPPAPIAPASPVAGAKMELGKIIVKPQNGTQGYVLTVDTEADFVICNLGLKQGIKPDDLLSVYRGNNYLGDIKATRVQDEMSAADLVPPLTSKEVQKNDSVVLKP